MFVCIMHKKEKQVREKWKKTREHLDEKGKILYIKGEAIPLGLRYAGDVCSYQLLCSARIAFHLSGANETQQRRTDGLCPLRGFFFEKMRLLRRNASGRSASGTDRTIYQLNS